MDTYKKKYNEALELARIYRDNAKAVEDYAAVARYENIFPVLRESEDERVRRHIAKFIDEQYPEHGSLKAEKEKMLAYIEKQKEQKPIDYPCLPGWRKNRDDNKPELKRSVLMLTTHGVAEGEWLGEKWCQYRWACELKDGEVLYWMHLSGLEWLEKEGEENQKEQKPILEVFGFKVGDAVRLKDGDGRKHIIKSFEEVEGVHGPNFYHVEFEDNSARDGIYPGEEYPNGYYTQMEKFEEEQKPAEWSEEDEANFAWFDKFFRAESVIAGGRDIPQDKYLWFKSLRPQKKQERSEEDDATIKSAVHWLEKYLSTIRAKDVSSATQEGILTVKTTITNLKSLHLCPSWKPSEEQMTVLGKFLKFLHESGSQDFGLMDSLLGQLKKL